MAGEIKITVIGNLTSDPELRFTAGGKAVSNFTVASTPRFFKDGEWRDGEATFLRCSVWDRQAENVAESFTRGDRVIVTGNLQQRSFETKEGEKRSVMEMLVDEVGPSVKWNPAKVNRPERSKGHVQTAEDPWGDNTPPGAYGGAQRPQGGGGFPDDPPF